MRRLWSVFFLVVPCCVLAHGGAAPALEPLEPGAVSLDGGALRRQFDEVLDYYQAGDSRVLIRPYYAFRGGERYFMYFNPEHRWNRINGAELNTTPEWTAVDGLAPGRHTLRITVLPEANPVSRGRCVNVVGLELKSEE